MEPKTLLDTDVLSGLMRIRHVDRRSTSAKDEAEVLDSVRLHPAPKKIAAASAVR